MTGMFCEKSSVVCSGQIKLYSGTQARACSFSQDVYLCTYHFFQTKRNEDCCFPFPGPCSSGLHDCPTRLFSVFEALNPNRVGTKICNIHLKEAEELEIITSHPLYKKARARKKPMNDEDATESLNMATLKKIKVLEDENKKLKSVIEEQTQELSTLHNLQEENLKLTNMLQDHAHKEFDILVKQFQKAFTNVKQQEAENLLNPEEMKKFCTIHSPGLFELIYKSIANDEKQPLTKERCLKQEVRVVSLLHTMSFFRNQKTNQLQKFNGLHLKLSGASYDSLMSGMIMGYSCHPNTLVNYCKDLVVKNKSEVLIAIKSALTNKSIIILLEDDIHFIHTKKSPREVTSTSWHMCTGLVDIHDKIPAIPRPNDPSVIHRLVVVELKNGQHANCRGGANVADLFEFFTNNGTLGSYFNDSYLEAAPRQYREIDLSIAKESCENLRVYSGEDRHALELLNTTWLIDEFLQDLHSKYDYRIALQHLLDVAPVLAHYMNNFLLVLGGDYPTWKYNKKIVAEWDPVTDPQHIPSLIPWQGPFHINLNIQETTVIMFRPFFEKLYQALFGNNKKLPKRPKSEKIALLISAAFGGWTIVQDMVKNQFGFYCKDPQYLLLLHLLDEVVPLVFYYYVVDFRGGDFDHWLGIMFRVMVQFVIFRRRNYDKATICHLSDILYHLKSKPHFVNVTSNYLNVLTEKKVEVFHSKLRRAVPVWANPDYIQNQAHVLSAQRFQAQFNRFFMPRYCRGVSQENLSLHAIKAAGFIIDVFGDVWLTTGQTVKIPKGRRKYQTFYLPALDATLDQRSLPLSFAFEENLYPDPTVFCDLPQCNADEDSQPNVKRLHCGHSFHKCCILEHNHRQGDHMYAIPQNISCPLCTTPLRARIESLALTINRYLAGEDDEVDSDEENNDEDNNDDDDADADDDCDSDNKIPQNTHQVVKDTKERLADKLRALPKIQNLEPMFGNRLLKPTTSTTYTHPKEVYRCCFPGCKNVYKTKGGLDRHAVSKKHSQTE